MDHPSQQHERAVELVSEGRIDRALEAFADARSGYEQRGSMFEAVECSIDVGYALVESHRPGEAVDWFEWAVRNATWAAQAGRSRVGLAAAEMDVGRSRRAVALLWEAFEDFGQVADRDGMALVQFEMGNAMDNLEEPEESLAHYRAALEVYEQRKDTEGIARTLQSMAGPTRRSGNTLEAIDLQLRARELWLELGDTRGVASCTYNLAGSYWDIDDTDNARRCYEEAHDLYDSIGSRVQAADCARSVGELLVLEGQHLEAVHRLFAARAVYDRIEHPIRLAMCEASLGWCALHSDDLDAAEAWFESAQTRYGETDYARQVARARVGTAITLDRKGDNAQARQIMSEVKDVLGPQDPGRWCPDCLEAAVDLGLETV